MVKFKYYTPRQKPVFKWLIRYEITVEWPVKNLNIPRKRLRNWSDVPYSFLPFVKKYLLDICTSERLMMLIHQQDLWHLFKRMPTPNHVTMDSTWMDVY